MGKFLSIDRTFGPRFPRVVSLVERLALFPRINELAEEFGHGSMNEFIDALERNCGRYQIEPKRVVPRGDVPSVLFSNHPIGGVDAVAAMRLLLADGEPFKMLTARVVEVPPAAASYVIPVDPTGKDQAFNGRAMARLLRGFGRDYSRLFVFPSGLSSRFDLSRMTATDPAWSDAYCRIALRANANLIPMWFSGHCSPLYYLLCLLFGRSGRVALPREFFRPKTQPLVARIGVPIPAKSTVYFGDQRAAALRAATYSLELDRGPDPRLWCPKRLSNQQDLAASEVLVLAGDTVDRDSVLALRRECQVEDEWSEADTLAQHIVVHAGSRRVASCSILPWSNLSSALLERLSEVQSVFVPDANLLRDHRVVEFGQLCVHPDFGPRVVEAVGGALRRTAFATGDTAIAVGVVSLAGHNPVLASAQFEFARRVALSALSHRFAPKAELIGASSHHDFRPERIRYDQQPTVAGLPSALQNYLALGAKFGPSATWMQRGASASVVATISG